MSFDKKSLAALEAPRAEKIPASQTHHGITMQDDYAWLRANNWQEAMREPEKLPDNIKAYLVAENEYQDKILAETSQRREALVEEMKGRIKQDDSSIPAPDGPFDYWVKFDEGADYPVYMRRKKGSDDAQIIFDAQKEGAGKDYFQLGDVTRNPDHTKLAWGVDENGSEYYQLRFRDIASGKNIGETLNDIDSAVWVKDDELYYALVDENHRPSKIFRHKIGTEQSADELIFEETDPRFFCGVDESGSEQILFISASVNDQDEVQFIDLRMPEKGLQMVEPRQDEHEYDVDHHEGLIDGVQGDRFIIATNADGAEDFKLMICDVANPSRQHWRDFVPHKKGRTIVDFDLCQDFLIRVERENALPRIVIRELATGEEHAIAFEEEAYALGADIGDEWHTQTMRFSYTSPTTPAQTWEYNMRTRERHLLKEQEIPSGHNPEDYVTRRLMVPSHDGELVPATVLYKAGLKLDGTAPCFLYAYGSYGHSLPASFSSSRLSLVDRGFVHVVAHVRGGAEKGRNWYNQTKKGGKHHTFKDFIAVGEHLASQGYTSRGKIVANGGSAGGMLMGAVANMAPDLFGGIIADVPFVDVLNTMLDASLPLTPGEWSQWGNPIESEEEYKIISSYSPYDNVSAQNYPHLLVLAGVSDPRVTYWEPAKWVAKMRELKTDDNVLMLKTNMTSGHFGQTGRFGALDDTALVYDFAMRAVGV